MKEDILKALHDWNPWFSGPFPAALRGFSRDYPIFDYLKLPEIKILEGARRVGKSTLLYQVIEHILTDNKKALYINFDDTELCRYSLKTIIETYLETDTFDCIFLDEIQHCPDWVHYIRNMYDRKMAQQIWITGSNASLIKKEYKTLLSGRNITISIYPLSFREYLRFQNCDIDGSVFSTEKEIQIKRHLKNYITFGAFPAIALREVYQKELLINYFEDFIYKDIATRYSVNNSKLRDLGIYLATNSAKLFSYRKIATALAMHVNTILDYITYYQEVFLFTELYKFDYSLKAQFGSEKKIYCADTGLAAAISFLFSDDKGRMLENLVHNELRRRHQEIYFHKYKNECDFIIKNQLEITQVIQVCHSLSDATTKKRELQGLIDALHYYPQAQPLIITADEHEQQQIHIGTQPHMIKIIPLWRWLLQYDGNTLGM